MIKDSVKSVYLDYASTTPIDRRVAEAMAPYQGQNFGNASSIHEFGRKARSGIERAREQASKLIRALPEEIYFTSGGTESDNWALTGYAFANRDRGNHIVTSAAEHHAVLHTCEFLESQGFEVTYVPFEQDGVMDVERIKDAVTEKTILISVMHVNNEIGTINDIAATGALARESGAAFHTDAVQSFGKLPIDVNSMNIDLLSASAHKIYGPKGVGLLYIRNGITVTPMLHGGSHERNLRAGTENVAGIVGFGAAAKICRRNLKDSSRDDLAKLRDHMKDRILSEIPDSVVNGCMENRIAENLNVSFAKADGESILLSLDLRGVAASSGAACSAGGIEPSHVIRLLELPEEYHDSSVRFSLGRKTTRSDVDYAVEVLKEIVTRIRNL